MKLKDTVTGMVSDNYKERLQAEFDQTIIRYYALQTDLTEMGERRNLADLKKIEVYRKQCSILEEYIRVLQERAGVENIQLSMTSVIER